ncbi:unnamed protein product, partial [Symbiodinium pilosum]
AQNMALKRALNQRPIVYQFAPPDAGIDSPDEEAADAVGQVEELGSAQSITFVGRHVALSCARRCVVVCTQCRKQRWIWGLEHQLRWFTRRVLERPLLMWAFYLHVVVLWCLEAWRQ